MKNGYLKYIPHIAILAVIYVIGAKLGLRFALVNVSATAIWPPTGIGLAALLLFGYRIWPGIFIGAFFANFFTAGNTLTSLGIALGNTLESIAGVYLINKYARGIYVFERTESIFTFAVLGAIFATAISATIGVVTLFLGGLVNAATLWQVWLTWWLGDMGGALILTPFIVLWANEWKNIKYSSRDIIDLAVAFGALAAVNMLIFSAFSHGAMSHYPLAFLLIPIIAWIDIRFSLKEAATATITVAIFGIWGTLHGYGPYAIFENSNASLLLLQGFLAVSAVTSLVLASTVAQNKKTSLELADASRTKDNFISILGHELRNPLAPIKSYVQILELKGPRDQEEREALDGIEKSLKSITGILNDLADVSRLRTGKVLIQKEIIDLNNVIARAIENTRSMMEARNHTLKIEKPDRPVLINADPLRIEQILSNLLSNAAKYTDSGGNIRIVLKKDAGQAAVLVEDNGIGIEPEMFSSVFELFRQADKSENNKNNWGLGIGLYTAKNLAELHGGKITPHSRGKNKGSTFTLTLPA